MDQHITSGKVSSIIQSKYYINIPIIIGHISKTGNYLSKDFYQFMYKTDYKISKTLKTRLAGSSVAQLLQFNDYNIAINSLNYLMNNKLAKFSLIISKMSAHLDTGELKYVPFFDFNNSYTESEIYDMLNLTNQEIKFIERTII